MKPIQHMQRVARAGYTMEGLRQPEKGQRDVEDAHKENWTHKQARSHIHCT